MLGLVQQLQVGRCAVYKTFLVDVEGEEGLSETASAADNVEEVRLKSGEVEHKLCHPTQSQVLGELGRGREGGGNKTSTVDLKSKGFKLKSAL